MTLLIISLIVIGFFFPPAWLALVGIGIYLFASRKSRRSEAVESRIKQLISTGKDHAVFEDLYFEAAHSYAVDRGAKAPEKNAASTHVVVDGCNYFVVFSRSVSGGTTIGIEEADAVRKRFDNVFENSRKAAPASPPKAPSSILSGLDFGAEILLVTQSGKILMTANRLEHENQEHLDGSVFEIMVTMRSSDPFFIYYKCDDYYLLLQQGAATQDAKKGMQWREAVSQKSLAFLRDYMLHSTRKDIAAEMVSYHHNVKHTNVIAYVEKLGGWYPIQQNDHDHEDTTERRVAAINNGSREVMHFIATSELSPDRPSQIPSAPENLKSLYEYVTDGGVVGQRFYIRDFDPTQSKHNYTDDMPHRHHLLKNGQIIKLEEIPDDQDVRKTIKFGVEEGETWRGRNLARMLLVEPY